MEARYVPENDGLRPYRTQSYSLHQLREEHVRERVLHIRGTVSFVSLRGHMGRGQHIASAVEFVLSPLRIGFPITIIDDNPVLAVLAQPTVRFNLEGWFLGTAKGVNRRPKFQMLGDPTLSWRDSSSDGLPMGWSNSWSCYVA